MIVASEISSQPFSERPLVQFPRWATSILILPTFFFLYHLSISVLSSSLFPSRSTRMTRADSHR
jgi:hypothetical protein